MSKAVFTTKVSPGYDDLPESRYHFPRTYLRQVEAAVGDWIIYYEPRRTTADLLSSGGRQAYFATARLDGITADPSRAGHFYAHVSQYLEFPRVVSFADGEHYCESSLRKDDGTTNKGAFGRAVRHLPDAEYDLILAAGFARILEGAPAEPIAGAPAAERLSRPPGFADLEEPTFDVEGAELQPRPIVQQLVSRPFRERAFAKVVKATYRDTCAITGLRLINGGGRSEVQAAHIRPVAADGPDSVRNGLALSATVHWMFDRGLLSIGDDYSLLIAKDRVPDTMNRLLPAHGRISLPDRREFRPHSQYLSFHRREIFKG